MKKIVAINGESWAKNLTGIERVAQDTVTYLDKICSPNEFELVVPIRQGYGHVPHAALCRSHL